MDPVKVARIAFTLRMLLARREITVKIAGEERKTKSAKTIQTLEQTKLKRGKIMSWHSKFSNMSALEIRGRRMLSTLRMSMKR